MLDISYLFYLHVKVVINIYNIYAECDEMM